MIIFEKIRWKNFLSTGNQYIEIDLTQKDTTLIVGTNGAGKSTVLDALTFSLFNKPFRKINKSQLINATNEKDCVVEVEFTVNNKDYLVRRSIKPNKFDIEVNGTLLHKESDDRLNQKILETIGCIEDEITFKLENCCSHFYQLCKSLRGEEKAGINLAPLLEYGTMEHKEIEVQDFGFSRMAAAEIVKNYKHCISFTRPLDKVVIDINKLKQSVKPDSLIGRELSWIAK